MAGGWTTVRVFISSTFLDMHAERDHLINEVFDELRERMAPRHLHLRLVDLRWGVPKEEDSVRFCLDLIEECRPYFIGLIGNRYGSIPPPPRTIEARAFEAMLRGEDGYAALDERDAEILRRAYEPSDLSEEYILSDQPPDHARQHEILDVLARARMWGAGHSITAMEILRGVLDDPEQRTISYFYFRDPKVSEAIPPPHWANYNEGDPVLREKLAQLRLRIENAGLRPRPYECTWDESRKRLVGLEEFGRMVLEDLWAAIDAAYPAGHEAEIDPWADEREAMEFFAEARTEHFVGRRDFLERLHAFVLDRFGDVPGNSGLLALVGEPGSGKTSLLARFFREYREGHPDDAVVAHFVGASAASTDVEEMLGRIWIEVSAATGVVVDRPQRFRELVQAFPGFLEEAAAVRPVCILIDAVNQLEDTQGAREMRWLPEVVPPRVCFVVSTQEGVVADMLRRREAPVDELRLSLLSEKEAEDLVTAYLDQNMRKLSAEHTRDLVAKPAARNPLYLLVALEELRATGRFDTLGAQIGALPGDVTRLFEALLDRLEQQHGKELVCDFLALLAVGRGGQLEEALQVLLRPEGQPKLPDLQWAKLFRSLRFYVLRRSEFVDFFHPQLREAVWRKYLSDPSVERRYHGKVAAYLSDRGYDYPRALNELPYHLHQAGMAAELFELVGDVDFRDRKIRLTGSVHGLVSDIRLALRAALDRGDYPRSARFGFMSADYSEGRFGRQDVLELQERDPQAALFEARLFPKRPRFRLLVLMALREAASGQTAAAADLVAEAAGVGEGLLPETDTDFVWSAVVSLLEAGSLDSSRLLAAAFQAETAARQAARAAPGLDPKLQELLLLSAVRWAAQAASKDALPRLELFKELVEAAGAIAHPHRRELVFAALETRADDFKGLMARGIETQDILAFSLGMMAGDDRPEAVGWTTGIGAPEAARAHVAAARIRTGDEQRGAAEIDDVIATCSRQRADAAALAEIVSAIRTIPSGSSDWLWRLLGIAVGHEPERSLRAILAALADESGEPPPVEAVDAVASTADAISPRLSARLARPLAIAYARSGAAAQARERVSPVLLSTGQLRVIGLNPVVAPAEKLEAFREQAELVPLLAERDRDWVRSWLPRMAEWAMRLGSDERRDDELSAIVALSVRFRERSGFEAVVDATDALRDQDLRAARLATVLEGAETLVSGERGAVRARVLRRAGDLDRDARRKVLARWLETVAPDERQDAGALLREADPVERDAPGADLLGGVAGLFARTGEWPRAEELWYAAALADSEESPTLFVARATAAARATDAHAWDEALRDISPSSRALVELLAAFCEDGTRLEQLGRRVRAIPWAAFPVARAWVRFGDPGRAAQILLRRLRRRRGSLRDDEFAEFCELGRLAGGHRLGRALLVELIPHAYSGETDVDRFGLLADSFSELPDDWSRAAYAQLNQAAGEGNFISQWRTVEARAAIAAAVARNGHPASARALLTRTRRWDVPKRGTSDDAVLQPHARASALLRLVGALRELHAVEPNPALDADAHSLWREGVRRAAEIDSEFFRSKGVSLLVQGWVEARRWGWADADDTLESIEEATARAAASIVRTGDGSGVAQGWAELGENERALSVAAQAGGRAREDVLVDLAGRAADHDLREAGRYFELTTPGEGRRAAASAIAKRVFRLNGRPPPPNGAAPAGWSTARSALATAAVAVVLVLLAPAVLYWLTFRELDRIRDGLAEANGLWWLVALLVGVAIAVRALMRRLRRDVQNPAARFGVSLLAIPLLPLIAPIYVFARYLRKRPSLRATTFTLRKRFGERLRPSGGSRPLSRQPTYSRREDLADIVWLSSVEAEAFDILFGSLLASVSDPVVVASTLESLPELTFPPESAQPSSPQPSRWRKRRPSPEGIQISDFSIGGGGVTQRRRELSSTRGLRRIARFLIATVLRAGLAVTGVLFIPLRLRTATERRRNTRRGNELAQRGGAILGQARPAEALPLLEEATRLLPDNAAVWNDYAVALAQLGETGRAIEAHRTATAKAVGTPVLAHAWFNYGCTLQQAGRYREGVEAFDRALARLLPGSAEREQARLGRDLCEEMLVGGREGSNR